MPNGEIAIFVAIGSAIGAVVSVLVGGLLTLWGQWLNRRSDERRQFMDLCFKAATENLARDLESAKNLAGARTPIAPIDLYLIHMLSLIGIFRKGNLSQEEMIAQWIRTSNRTRTALEEAVKKDASKM